MGETSTQEPATEYPTSGPGRRRVRWLVAGLALLLTCAGGVRAIAGHHRFRAGHALAQSDLITLSLGQAPLGDIVYYSDPELFNESGAPLTIVSMHVRDVPSELVELSHRSNDSRETSGGAIGFSDLVGIRDEPDLNPNRYDPRPVDGVVLAPHSGMPEHRQVMVAFKVVKAGDMVDARDVVVIYRQRGALYSETLACQFEIQHAGQ